MSADVWTYTVRAQQASQSGVLWIVDQCGHTHSTLTDALRCRDLRRAQDPIDSMRCWVVSFPNKYGFERHYLTPDEQDELDRYVEKQRKGQVA